jgi:hypothetical protein
LKSLKKEPSKAFTSIEKYEDVVRVFNNVPCNEALVTDPFRTSGAIKKGLDRSIKKCGYLMTTSVQNGRVVIKK